MPPEFLGTAHKSRPHREGFLASSPGCESDCRSAGRPLIRGVIRAQIGFLFGRLPSGRGLRFGFGEHQRELVGIVQDVGLLGGTQAGIESGAGLLLLEDAVDGQRQMDRAARGLRVGGEIHSDVQRSDELASSRLVTNCWRRT